MYSMRTVPSDWGNLHDGMEMDFWVRMLDGEGEDEGEKLEEEGDDDNTGVGESQLGSIE